MKIDRERLKSFLGCEDEFLKILFKNFVADSKLAISDLEESVNVCDKQGIYNASHKLLTSTRLLELSELTESLEKIEELVSKDTHIEDIQLEFEVTRTIYHRCLMLLSKELISWQ